MRAWWVEEPGPIAGGPLRLGEVDDPEPGPGQVRVRVSTCGVCRTDLHLAEGDLSPHRARTTPGHEIVGRVDRVGAGVTRFAPGDRIGIAWLRHTCGTCRFCVRGDENLCVEPAFTGWDAPGGFAMTHWGGLDPQVDEVLKPLNVTPRCIPLTDDAEPGTCPFTGRESKQRIVFAKSY